MDRPPDSGLVIYTIGHSNVPAARLIELLSLHKITTLVDVRSAPYSRYCPQFNRETLQYTLQEAGVEYLYAGQYLGGRPQDPGCYLQTQPRPVVDYPTVMTKDFFLAGIQRLLSLAQIKRVAVMCAEENPAHCHRHHLIGRYLTGQGISVLHIRGDGTLVADRELDERGGVQLRLL